MDTLYWLLGANAAVWIGLGCYLAFLGARERALALRVARWEQVSRG